MTALFRHLKSDLPASIVVFFVAVPLCLGIALASGAPLFAGVIAGVVGGIVVGAASGSPLGVSGPAAGLAVIVLSAIGTLNGSWEAFLVAVVLAGLLQIAMGFAGLGGIAHYFPSSVIKGMLTGIGLLIIMTQVPHALGMVAAPGDDIGTGAVTPTAAVIAIASLALLIAWEAWLAPRWKFFRVVPGPLAAVGLGMLLSALERAGLMPGSLGAHQLVAIPVAGSAREFLAQFSTPDFSALANPDVYTIALVLAIVASLETLLCVEATDRLDPEKRVTPTNRELKAQGLGNIVAGLIGGLPITQVIVRSSANLTFGARTKLSAVLHGVLLLACVMAIPGILNLIPLATLAAILIVVGYKLAKPALFRQMYQSGWQQFAPFMATVAFIVATDLLRGIGVGLGVAVAIVLLHNLRNPFTVSRHAPAESEYRIQLADQVSFLNKGRIREQLQAIPPHSRVVIDGAQTKVVDHDVREILRDFRAGAPARHIAVEIRGLTLEPTAV